MSVNIGSDDIYNMAVGGTDAKAVYLGSTKVWPFDPIVETNTARTNYAVPSGATGVYVTLIGAAGGGGGNNVVGTGGTGGAGFTKLEWV